ncbi:MAG: hypothetical protein ACLR0U_19000 [Enterocloster clostridioformis]
MSDIWDWKKAGNQSVFTVAEPVWKNGKVIGVLQTRLEPLSITEQVPGSQCVYAQQHPHCRDVTGPSLPVRTTTGAIYPPGTCLSP